MAVPIFTLIKMALKKPSILKAIAKYSGRGVLRKTGVFGTYGSIKKYVAQDLTKGELLKKITSSVLKKNFLRSLGSFNFVIDIFKKKGGIKYALKQFGFQKITPMAVKKLWYLHQNYQRTFGTKNPIIQESKKEIWKKLRISNKEHSNKWKLDQIETIMDTKGVDKKFKKELLNDWFYFKVASPETHNFNRTIYRWNPSNGELHCSIRSGTMKNRDGSRKIFYYRFFEYDIKIIRKMVLTSNYGRMIFWKLYSH